MTQAAIIVVREKVCLVFFDGSNHSFVGAGFELPRNSSLLLPLSLLAYFSFNFRAPNE